ncbi:MAG: DUF58 domain-containing protein [Candidatus Latescibacteria bacterium]|nr:DUF58 domain-containing protein [Candidatus Latescibacterota bacterium]
MNSSYQEYLSPETVSRLSRLDLIARFVVEGYITGLHKSPYHGFSAEFAEHRQYMPGDSLRYLDWKVYGRSDRMYIKRFEEETNLKSHIIVDVSGSMGFQSRGTVTKLRYASIIASALAFLMIRQRDSVGLVTFSDSIKTYVPPRSVQSQLKEIIKVLSSQNPDGLTVTGNVLHTMAERISTRGLIILISDLVVGADELIHGLKHFRHNGHEVIVFHVLDPMELDFDYDREVKFIDMETGRTISTQPWHIRDQYKSMLDQQLSRLVHSLHDISVDYARLTTDIPFDRALSEYLAKRKKLH